MQKRLDQRVCEQEKISRTKAQRFIEEGLVFVDDKQIKKVSFLVEDNMKIVLVGNDDYVSRGAYKLLGAIENFSVDFDGKIVLDLGASTGGFTQVCLKYGAKKVYAVDVGEGQLDKSLAEDERVVNLSKTDVRELDREKVGDADIIVGDLSFISLTKVLPKIKEIFGNKKEMVLLFKPQFECGPEIAKKYKGIIKNKEIHKKILKNFENFVKLLGFSLNNIIVSPIKGGDGNVEYLLHFGGEKCDYDIEKLVQSWQ